VSEEAPGEEPFAPLSTQTAKGINQLLAPGRSLVQRRVGHMLVFHDFSCIIEDPEVAFIRKCVLFAAREVFCIKRDEHEDLVAIREERVRLEALEREGCQALEECGNICRAATGLQPWNTGVGTSTSHSTFGSNLSMIAGTSPRPKHFVDLLDGVDVTHDEPLFFDS
jgi:hypothetical protein